MAHPPVTWLLPTPDPFEGAWAKLERAREHLQALYAQVRWFTDSKPHGFRAEYYPDRGEYIVRDDPRGRVVPPRLALIAGDVAHNLRSALDHLAVALASPPLGTGPGRNTAWPVFFASSDKEFPGQSKAWLEGVRQPYRTRIAGLQPYHAKAIIEASAFWLGNVRVSHSEVEQNRYIQILLSLELITRLDNLDKHNLVLPTYAIQGTDVPPLAGAKKGYKVQLPRKRLFVEDGAEIFRYIDIVPVGDAADVKMDGEPPAGITFGDPEWTHEEFWSKPRDKGAMTPADFRQAADDVEWVIGFMTDPPPAQDSPPAERETNGGSPSP